MKIKRVRTNTIIELIYTYRTESLEKIMLMGLDDLCYEDEIFELSISNERYEYAKMFLAYGFNPLCMNVIKDINKLEVLFKILTIEIFDKIHKHENFLKLRDDISVALYKSLPRNKLYLLLKENNNKNSSNNLFLFLSI